MRRAFPCCLSTVQQLLCLPLSHPLHHAKALPIPPYFVSVHVSVALLCDAIAGLNLMRCGQREDIVGCCGRAHHLYCGTGVASLSSRARALSLCNVLPCQASDKENAACDEVASGKSSVTAQERWARHCHSTLGAVGAAPILKASNAS